MAWTRLGRIFAGKEMGDWSVGYAAVPTAEHLEGDHYRVHFSARDRDNRSRAGWLVFDIEKLKVEDVGPHEKLAPGDLGAFDDSGVMPCWLTPHEAGDRLYYIGWNRGVTVPFRNAVGLAIRNGSGAFHRAYEGPVLDRSAREPYFTASCCVLREESLWRNWYLSCVGWEARADGPRHRYHIKYATSANGIDWDRDGHVAIDFSEPSEYAISRPCVLSAGGGYRMWFSARGDHYRIYEARSADGLEWTRLPDPVLDRDEARGWESEMVEYPYVFKHKGLNYMLYNGNGFGRTGFGLAVEEPAR